MKPNYSIKIKRIIFLFSYSFFLNSLFSINVPNSPISIINSKSCIQAERGLEIRYIIIQDKIEKEKNEIIIDHVKYPLFKTKESAIETIKYTNPKKDYTIVYVISEKKKNNEIISIPEGNN